MKGDIPLRLLLEFERAFERGDECPGGRELAARVGCSPGDLEAALCLLDQQQQIVRMVKDHPKGPQFYLRVTRSNAVLTRWLTPRVDGRALTLQEKLAG